MDTGSDGRLLLTVVGGLEFGRWDVPDGRVQTLVVPPVDPGEGGATSSKNTEAPRSPPPFWTSSPDQPGRWSDVEPPTATSGPMAPRPDLLIVAI